MLRAFAILAALLALPLFAQPAELSTIAVPIRTTLAPLVPIIEKQVPKTFRNQVTEHRVTVTYDVARDPIALRMNGDVLLGTTTTRYSLEACPGPFRCISCGIGEPKRQAVVSLESRLTWDAAWRLRSATTARPVAFPDRCTVTWFDFDITDHFIAPVVNSQLRDAVVTIDRNVPNLVSVRPMAQQIWTAMQAPFEIAPRTWLVFEPLAAGLGPVRGSGGVAESVLSMAARTRVVVGARPAATSRPLPALSNVQTSGGLRVPIDVGIPYDEATRLAGARYAKRTHKVDGGTIRIDEIRVVPAANGKVAVETTVDYDAGLLRRYSGPLRLEGTPRIEGDLVVVPDLDYVLTGTGRSLLSRATERVAHDFIRDNLREAATFPLKTHIANARAEITRGLNRQLAAGVFLRGTAEGVQPVAVTASPSGLSVRVVVVGSARVDVTAFRN